MARLQTDPQIWPSYDVNYTQYTLSVSAAGSQGLHHDHSNILVQP